MYFVRNLFKVISIYTLTIFAAFSMEKSVLYLKNTQHDGYMCEQGDIAATVYNIENGRMCLSVCAAHRCARIFYHPDLKLCLGCFSLHITDFLLTYTGTVHYETVLQCPSAYGQFNTSCYTYTETPMTWDVAKAHCENGNIVSIDNSDENEYVISWLQQQLPPLTGVTIWTEAHGNEQNFTIQPDNGANEVLLPAWIDVPCSESYPVVCEIIMV